MTVRVRGIYATALTALFGDAVDERRAGSERGAEGEAAGALRVVQASDAIDRRFDDREFRVAPVRATVATTDDRQGVGVVGDPETVADAVEPLRDVGIDALAWRDPTPGGALYDGEVSETVGSGAVVDLGPAETTEAATEAAEAATEGSEQATAGPLDSLPLAVSEGTGFLPFGNVDGRIEEGDRVRVQVREPTPPWVDDRPELDATVRVERSLLTLRRGGVAGTGGPHLGDVLPIDPPEGWGVRWDAASEDASLDALGDALERATERAEGIDQALDAALDDPPDATGEGEPGPIDGGDATAWVWFGRESRFALDRIRRSATPTMPGHHRTKTGADGASAAVDFVESLCPDLGDGGSPGTGGDDGGSRDEAGADDDAEFPFDTVTRHFGPREGDRVAIQHVKPDGRLLTLGRAEVASLDADGTVELRRELSSSGTYDGLGTRRERGDVATTKVLEGRWWYPTTYRSADGEHRGTYVNVCTPVEVFPGAVRYVDLHVDVVKRPEGDVERVDDDELDAAEAAGRVPSALAKKARAVASAVEKAL